MAYCLAADVIVVAGLYGQIINESVGTGDGLNKIFSLDNQKVLDNTQTIYVGGTAVTEASDYTIDNDTGIVTFTTAPETNATITAIYKYILPDMLNTDVEFFIASSDAEIDSWTGKKFTSNNEWTEYFSGRPEHISASRNVAEGTYYDETEEDKYLIMLKKYPVQSITSVTFLADDGTEETSLTENEDYNLWPDIGKIWIFTNVIPIGHNKKKVKVVYTYGYESVPETIKQLSATISAMQILIAMIGGSYEDMTTYTLGGGVSVSAGEPYMNLRATIDRLELRKGVLMNVVGREFRTIIC